ncbi:hypothetical protein DPMN_117595 [Dreissena polymorpha]|uniref:Uncharacterized protein n=1 Tax=Dreissena polymorpha TaxID=45954 RepID=A0A9D4GFT3_DREPO|nr:hypothetical protein DPMN_117595 [Dreissena polymorpha]
MSLEQNVLTNIHDYFSTDQNHFHTHPRYHLNKYTETRVLTRFYYSHIRKNATPLGSHVFQANFHEDRKINVDSRVLTRKNAPPPSSHVFQPTGIIFKLIQDIIGMNILTKFHEDETINVASRVHIGKNAPPLGSHVFQANVTIFELNRHIKKTHVLTKFHEDWTKNVTSRVFTCFHYIQIEKTAPPPGGHVFSTIWTIFKLVRDINETNVYTKFHDDWAKIVTSRVFTRNTAPHPGGHVFQRTGTIFELNQHIIKTNILTNFELSRGINGTNVLTKFHEDRTINVASRVFTRQYVDDGQKAIRKAHHELTR